MKFAIRWGLATVLLAASGIAASGPVYAQDTAASFTKEQLLDRWAAALGGRDSLLNARVIHIRGKLKTAGLEGSYDRWTTSRGEFRVSLEIPGAFSQVIIFDGQKGWVLDRSGIVQDLSGDRMKSVTSSAYESSDSFLFAGRLPGHLESAAHDDGQAAFVIQLSPDGGNSLKVYLDDKTFLPR